MNELLSPRALAELEAYRRRFRFPVRTGGHGSRASPFGGSSAEFLEHRDYEPGDDARRIDWNAYARSRNVVIKRFRAEHDAWVRVVLDASGSMAFGEPSKFVHAQRVAAALGYLALAQGERVDVCVASGGLKLQSDKLRGPSARGALLQALSRHGPRDESRLAEVLRKLTSTSKQRVALVVVSDFLEPEVTQALQGAAARGHCLLLVQVLTVAETSPTLFGDFNLEDAETGEQLAFSADDLSIAQYLRALTELQDGLRRVAQSSRGQLQTSLSDEPVSALLARMVAA